MALRVLHVIPAVAPRYGGPSLVIGPMCAALRARGIDACIATTTADGASSLELPLGTWADWQGTPAIFFRRNASEAFKYSYGLGRWLRRHVADFDVVHIHAVLSHAPLAAAAACRRARVPYIVRPLGTIASWSLGRKPWRKKLLLTLAANGMLERAATLHFTTEEEKEDAVRTFGLTRGTVIPLGLDVESFAPSAAELAHRASDPYVLALSRLHPKKNFEVLIDAFSDLLPSAGRGWRLVIAGDGEPEYLARLRAQVDARGLGRQVTFRGWVAGEEKRSLLAAASLFALPSHHENFGVSVLEAMAAGLPVLVSRSVQLAGETERAGAGWVCGTDLTDVSATLCDALRDPAERHRRGAAARQLASRFAWSSVAVELEACYRDTVSRAARIQPSRRDENKG